MEKLLPVKVFVLHVKNGFENRKVSIERELAKHKIEFEYMLDGDIEDLTEDILSKYFAENLRTKNVVSSCASKHLLIYEKMINEHLPNALVFEDDIFLSDNFNQVFNQTLTELNTRIDIKPELGFISYENYDSRIIPNSELIKGQLLYKRDSGRCTGAYFINHQGAKIMLDFSLTNKLSTGIDWQHNKVFEAGKLTCYWCHPPIAEQGSHNGTFDSAIESRKAGLFRRFRWLLKKYLKRFLYKFQ